MDPVEPSPEFVSQDDEPVSKDPIANIRRLMKKRAPRIRAKAPREGRSPKSVKLDLWRIAAGLSFVVNVLLVAFILVIGGRLLEYKNAVVEPLLEGVYAAIGQMDAASVETEVTVQSDIPVVFDLPVQRETVVTLSQPVRIEGAYLSIRSATFSVDAPTTIDLPVGAQLPITLDLTLPVSTTVPVELSVPVELNLEESDLQPAISALQELLEPYKALIHETPDCWQMLLWGGECP